MGHLPKEKVKSLRSYSLHSWGIIHCQEIRDYQNLNVTTVPLHTAYIWRPPKDEYTVKWWQRMLHQQVIKIHPEEIVPKSSDEEEKWVLNPCHGIDNDHWLTDKNTSFMMFDE